MYPWEIAGTYVGLCMCLYIEKERQGQETKRTTRISRRETALVSCVIDTSGRMLRGKKTGSITAMLYKGTPPFPLS